MDEEEKQEQDHESDTEETQNTHEGHEGADIGGSAETDLGEDDQGDRDAGDDFEEEPPAMTTSTGSADDIDRGRRIMNSDNEQILGVLTVEFPERTVSVVIDGDAAMRVLEAHRRGTRHFGSLGDVLNPVLLIGPERLDHPRPLSRAAGVMAARAALRTGADGRRPCHPGTDRLSALACSECLR